jgi:POT family proton-dependent oligopeptide transporter
MSNPMKNRTFLGHPRALLPLFSTELWERFSYYGIRPLLVLFMTASLMSGGLGIDRPTAAAMMGIFAGSVYLAALPGGWLADHILGQSRAVWWGSILVACGHLAIGLSAILGQQSFFVGLGLIVLGTGLFKTCISVLVGRLYTDDDPRRDGGFSIFYQLRLKTPCFSWDIRRRYRRC